MLDLIDGLIDNLARGAELSVPGDDDTVSTQCQLYRSTRGFWTPRLIGAVQTIELGMTSTEEDGGHYGSIDEESLRAMLDLGLYDSEWLME